MSHHLPALKPKAVLRLLKEAGFTVHHVSGSHYILRHPVQTNLRVTLPWHNKDLKKGTLASLIEQAGISIEEFRKLL